MQLCIAVRPTGADLVQPKIEFTDLGIRAQRRSRALHHDTPVLQDIAVIGDLQRECRVLFHQQHGLGTLAQDSTNSCEKTCTGENRVVSWPSFRIHAICPVNPPKLKLV
jgi:hypothetical protein